MTFSSPTPSRIPAQLASRFAAYAQRASTLAGTTLESLVLFGSVLTPDWRAGRRCHHALVLTTDDLTLIGRLGALSSDAMVLGLTAPLLVTGKLVQSTLDTFPLEWLEISTCHEVLHGGNPFQGLTFAREHVRLQCERESTVLAISVRQRLLHRDAATGPLTECAEHAVRILRGLLHLDGVEVPQAPSTIIAQAAARFALDLQPVAQAWDGQTGLPILIGLHRVLAALGERSDHG